MAKEAEKKAAYNMFVHQKRQQKDIAASLGVTEGTISGWVRKGGWQEERTAREIMPETQMKNIREIINDLAEQRIDLSAKLKAAQAKNKTEELEDLRKTISGIDDGVSKWNKTLLDLRRDTKVNLTTYIEVMEDITQALNQHDSKLAVRCAPFFEEHITTISLRLG